MPNGVPSGVVLKNVLLTVTHEDSCGEKMMTDKWSERSPRGQREKQE